MLYGLASVQSRGGAWDVPWVSLALSPALLLLLWERFRVEGGKTRPTLTAPLLLLEYVWEPLHRAFECFSPSTYGS